MTEEYTLPKSFSECLEPLLQDALNRKSTIDDANKARQWAIVRTELEKVLAYVRYIEEE